MKQIIQNFLDNVLGKLLNDNDVYNEFSFQHELGIYLRNELKKRGNYKVQFERNVNNVFGSSFSSVKKEMDIYIFNKDNEAERYAIELKFPRNMQIPGRMYGFVKDINFMEDVKNKGNATNAYTIALVENKNFYSGNCSSGSIYEYFRNGKTVSGKINKPKGAGNGGGFVKITGKYKIDWKPVLYKGSSYKSCKYFFVEM